MPGCHEVCVLESLFHSIHGDLTVPHQPRTATDRLRHVRPCAASDATTKGRARREYSPRRTGRKRIRVHVKTESQLITLAYVLANPLGGAAPRYENGTVARN